MDSSPAAIHMPNHLVSFLSTLEQERYFREALQPLLCGLRMRLQEIGKEDLARTFNGWFTEATAMRDDIQKHIDPDLPPLGQMKQMEELVMDWPDPDWAKGWLEAGREEGRKKGLAEGREKILGPVRKELCRQAASKFDPETVRRLTEHLDQISDPKLLVKISGRLTESKSDAALLKCLDGRA